MLTYLVLHRRLLYLVHSFFVGHVMGASCSLQMVSQTTSRLQSRGRPGLVSYRLRVHCSGDFVVVVRNGGEKKELPPLLLLLMGDEKEEEGEEGEYVLEEDEEG